MRCPTVRVKSEHSPDGYIVINATDLNTDHEVVPDDAPAEPPHADNQPNIPANWQAMHWKQQVKLAKALGREGEPSGEEAKAFIALKIDERAAAQ